MYAMYTGNRILVLLERTIIEVKNGAYLIMGKLHLSFSPEG